MLKFLDLDSAHPLTRTQYLWSSPGHSLRLQLCSKDSKTHTHTPTDTGKHTHRDMCERNRYKLKHTFWKADDEHKMYPHTYWCRRTHTHTPTNTSLLSCVPCHAMRSTWHKSGVLHDLLSNKSVPQRELMGETVLPPACPVRRQSWGPHPVSHAVSRGSKAVKCFELKNCGVNKSTASPEESHTNPGEGGAALFLRHVCKN